MNRDNVVFAVVGGIGFALIVAQGFFQHQSWWPPAFKVPIPIPGGVLLALVLMLLALLGFLSWGEMRSRSEVVLSDNQRWSYNPGKDKVRQYGSWAAVTLGGINAWGFSLRGKDGTLVFHPDVLEPRSANLNIRARSRLVELGELPEHARSIIRKGDLPAPYYFADVPCNVDLRDPQAALQAMQFGDVNQKQDLRTINGMATLQAQEYYINTLKRQIESPTRHAMTSWVGRTFGGGKSGGGYDDERGD